MVTCLIVKTIDYLEIAPFTPSVCTSIISIRILGRIELPRNGWHKDNVHVQNCSSDGHHEKLTWAYVAYQTAQSRSLISPRNIQWLHMLHTKFLRSSKPLYLSRLA